MQEILMHLVSFVHMNPYNRSHTFIPFVESSQRFLTHIKFVSPSALVDGTPFIAEAGMEDDKRSDRNLAKAEAARRLAGIQGGVFWLGTEANLTKAQHYNLV